MTRTRKSRAFPLPGRMGFRAAQGHGNHFGRTLRGGFRRAAPRPTAPPSGTVWIIDLRSRAVVATVTGVGNDPYGLTLVEGDED